MERSYQEGTKSDVTVFTGIEIEHTPAYGKKTLFVVGIHNSKLLIELANENQCDHIYLGANHSYRASDFDSITSWELMTKSLLDAGYWVTLDIDFSYYDFSLDLLTCLCGYNKFIPQISVKLTYISNLNYNTCIKIDDKDFQASNPGVWVHHLHDLMDRKKFTDWSQYGKDKIIQ